MGRNSNPEIGEENPENRAEATSESGSFNRRSFLGRVSGGFAATSVTMAGLSSTIAAHPGDMSDSEMQSAIESSKRAFREYSSPGAIRDAVETHAGELLEHVHATAIPEAPEVDVENLRSEPWIAANLPGTKREFERPHGLKVWGSIDENQDPITYIKYSERVPAKFSPTDTAGKLILLVIPQKDRSFAHFKSTGSESAGVDTANDVNIATYNDGDVTIESHCTRGLKVEACNIVCGYIGGAWECGCEEYEFRCLDGDCCTYDTGGFCGPCDHNITNCSSIDCP